MNPSFPLDDRWWLQLQPDIQEKNLGYYQFYNNRDLSMNEEGETKLSCSIRSKSSEDDFTDDKLSSGFPSYVSSDFSDYLRVDTVEQSHMETMCGSASKSLRSLPEKTFNEDCTTKQSKLMDASGFEVSIDSYLSNRKPYDRNGTEWRKADQKELASIVAVKAITHLQNCDLPPPQRTPVANVPRTSSPLTEDIVMPKHCIVDLTSRSSCRSPHKENGLGILLSEDSYSGSRVSESTELPHADKRASIDASQTDIRVLEDVQSLEAEDSRKSDLLDALRHSQTRAREAERLAAIATTEREKLLSLFLKEASYHFVHRQWMRFLEIEITILRLQLKALHTNYTSQKQSFHEIFKNRKAVQEKNEKFFQGFQDQKKRLRKQKKLGTGVNWGIAITVGISLAGAGLILGWSMGWIFPKL